MEDQQSCIPTRFAVAMCRSADLYENDLEFVVDFSDHDRLEMFQSLAISGTYDDCIVAAYFGKELSDQQILILTVIHKLTQKWVVGRLSQRLMDRLEMMGTFLSKGKDLSDMTETIMRLMGMNQNDGGTQIKRKSTSRLQIEFTTAELKNEMKNVS